MAFNSFLFLLFLTSTVTIFYLSPAFARLRILFCFGYLWYAFWSLKLSIFLFFYTVASYYPLRALLNIKNKQFQRICLYIFLAFQTAPLIYFKYTNFLLENISELTSKISSYDFTHSFEILLPLGISFYVFQTISFTVDCFRQSKLLSKSFIEYSTYISFFPQLVAGPIVRFETFKRSVKRITGTVPVTYVAEGIRRITYGLALKLLIADNLGAPVDEFFSNSFVGLSGWDVWTIAFLFGFQIYFDFSAYSQIAIGSALFFGIRLSSNFNYPYLAVNPKDFWQRWHISLSSWVRDYLYLPLFQTSKPAQRDQTSLNKHNGRNIALLISWMVMGLWHGASWNFLLWGVGHAILILFFRYKSFMFPHSNNVAQIALSYVLTTAGVMALWIPFRAETVHDTIVLWKLIVNPFSYGELNLNGNVYLLATATLIAFYSASLVRTQIVNKLDTKLKNLLSLAFSSLLIALVLIFLQVRQQFIYFQF